MIDGDLDNNNTPDITVSEITNSNTNRVFLIDNNASLANVAINGLKITRGDVTELGNSFAPTFSRTNKNYDTKIKVNVII